MGAEAVRVHLHGDKAEAARIAVAEAPRQVEALKQFCSFQQLEQTTKWLELPDGGSMHLRRVFGTTIVSVFPPGPLGDSAKGVLDVSLNDLLQPEFDVSESEKPPPLPQFRDTAEADYQYSAGWLDPMPVTTSLTGSYVNGTPVRSISGKRYTSTYTGVEWDYTYTYADESGTVCVSYWRIKEKSVVLNSSASETHIDYDAADPTFLIAGIDGSTLNAPEPLVERSVLVTGTSECIEDAAYFIAATESMGESFTATEPTIVGTSQISNLAAQLLYNTGGPAPPEALVEELNGAVYTTTQTYQIEADYAATANKTLVVDGVTLPAVQLLYPNEEYDWECVPSAQAPYFAVQYDGFAISLTGFLSRYHVSRGKVPLEVDPLPVEHVMAEHDGVRVERTTEYSLDSYTVPNGGTVITTVSIGGTYHCIVNGAEVGTGTAGATISLPIGRTMTFPFTISDVTLSGRKRKTVVVTALNQEYNKGYYAEQVLAARAWLAD